jgi:DNA-directed RNA polymerase specialized sigma24 family protein
MALGQDHPDVLYPMAEDTRSSMSAFPDAAEPDAREDRDLVRRFSAGCDVAAKQLFAATRDRVERAARRLLAWPDQVDDVTQEVYLAALTHRRSFRHEAQLLTWLLRITINACRAQRRRDWVRRRCLAWFGTHRPPTASTAPADARLDQHDQAATVRRILDGLAVYDWWPCDSRWSWSR